MYITEIKSSAAFAQLRYKLPIGYNRAPHILPPNFPSRGPIPKPNYLPHPWTHLTYHPKPHSYSLSRFATMHLTDRQTDTQSYRLLEGMFDNYMPLYLYIASAAAQH